MAFVVTASASFLGNSTVNRVTATMQPTLPSFMNAEEARQRRRGAIRMAWGLAALVLLIYGLGFWLG